MTRAVIMLLAAAMLSACGGAVRIYRGTSTSQVSFGGSGSQTTTTTGALVHIYAGSDQNELIFEVPGPTGTVGWNATVTGTAVNFTGNQSVTTTVQNSGSTSTATQTLTLASGTGTMDQTQLTLNIAGTQASNSGTGTGTGSFTSSFSGIKE
jgi:hypothetical protein